jgi:hypothetical protein
MRMGARRSKGFQPAPEREVNRGQAAIQFREWVPCFVKQGNTAHNNGNDEEADQRPGVR